MVELANTLQTAYRNGTQIPVHLEGVASAAGLMNAVTAKNRKVSTKAFVERMKIEFPF